jgi:alpha/beta superfamily hydrolase
LSGPCGEIEALRDEPVGGAAPRGVAVIAHPHPLFGGTMDNKVVQTLARAYVQCGYAAVRFNFRGVGASAGHYDEGRGEVADMQSVVAQQVGDAVPLCLAGFSFGAYVTSEMVQLLKASRAIESIALIGAATSRFELPALPPELAWRALLIHGELDDTVPLASLMDWARPQNMPVTVVPAAGHFFHGQLPLLKSLLVRHIRGVAVSDDRVPT